MVVVVTYSDSESTIVVRRTSTTSTSMVNVPGLEGVDGIQINRLRSEINAFLRTSDSPDSADLP